MRAQDNESIRAAGSFGAARALATWIPRDEVADTAALLEQAYQTWRDALRREDSPSDRHLFTEGWVSTWDDDISGYDVQRTARRLARNLRSSMLGDSLRRVGGFK